MQEYRDDDDGDDDSELDLSVIKDYLGFAFRALRIRPLLALGVFVGVVVFAYGVLRTLPRTYHVESKMMAQKDTGLGKNNPWGPDPLKGASDVVKGHEQLVALVKQLDLINWWQAHLAPAQRFRLWVMDGLGHATTEDEWMRILVETLDTKMQITPGDGTVTFAVDWTEGMMAARLVDTAEQNFLERRHVMEISTIAESVSILEGHAAKLRQEIEELTAPPKEEPEDKDKKAASAGAAPRPVAVAPAPKKAAHRSPEMDAELARQKVIIEAKQRAINDLEDFRQRRVLELQANLAEQRAKYTDQHPIIVGIQQNIASFSHESPQVTQLRSEVKALQEAYANAAREADAASGVEPGAPRSVAGLAAPASDITSLLIARNVQRDPAMEAQITYAVNKYSEIRAQISTARIDLDLAQAAFRYRYTVVVPAEPPKGPSKPKVPLIMAAAAIAGLFFGLVATVIAEIRSGRLVTRFQVERVLNLPVLAELSLPQGDGSGEKRS